MNELRAADPQIARAIERETLYQSETIDLNAATNFPNSAVIQAQGNVLANKTLEGYPGKRYHGGCKNVDTIEKLGIERAKKLFGAEHANIQPHSGVLANMAVYVAMLNPGDVLLGMDLASGGHLSHGHEASFSGKVFRSFSYGVDSRSELIDYEEVRQIAYRTKPKMIICGGSSYPRTINFSLFREIADEVGAYLLADIAHVAGLVAGKAYPSPVSESDFVTFTTYKTFGGSRGGTILCKSRYGHSVDNAVFPGVQGSMHVQLMAGKAVTFKIASTGSFRRYAHQVIGNARTLSEALLELGYRIVTGGTDTHLVLIDLQGKAMTGAQAQELLEQVNIVCNKNRIPFDPRGPDLTSGLRLGTSAVTARGFQEAEMFEVAEMIDAILSQPEDAKGKRHIRQKVKELCGRYAVNCLTDPPQRLPETNWR